MARLVLNKLKRSFFWVRSHKLLSLLLFIVLLVGGIVVYEKIALELNKRAFQHARTAIDAVYADIVKQVGPPDNAKSTSMCNVVREEFSNGPIYCFISSDFTYGVSSKQEAETLFKKVQKIIGERTELFKVVKLTDSIEATTVGNDTYQSTHDYYRSSGIDCTFSYVYDTPKLTGLSINDANKKILEVGLGCSSKTQKAYYALEN